MYKHLIGYVLFSAFVGCGTDYQVPAGSMGMSYAPCAIDRANPYYHEAGWWAGYSEEQNPVVYNRGGYEVQDCYRAVRGGVMEVFYTTVWQGGKRVQEVMRTKRGVRDVSYTRSWYYPSGNLLSEECVVTVGGGEPNGVGLYLLWEVDDNRLTQAQCNSTVEPYEALWVEEGFNLSVREQRMRECPSCPL